MSSGERWLPSTSVDEVSDASEAEVLPWYVVYTKPNQEMRAEAELMHQQFTIYLPRLIEMQRRHKQLRRTIKPMFPRYLFVQPMHSEHSIAPIKATRGVSHLIRQGSKVIAVPESLIESIRVSETQLNHQGTRPYVMPGQSIEVIDGPFRGVVSRVVAATGDRVSILLEVLGQLRPLEFPVELCRRA